MKLSPCGVACNQCQHYQESCAGCPEHEGQVFWANFVGGTICPLYDCAVNQKKLGSCAKCPELPCRLFYDIRDPGMTEAEHRETIDRRVAFLRDAAS